MTSILERLRQWRRPVWDYNTYNRAQWVAEQARRLPPGARVLDVGAGVGQYRALFAHCDYKAQDFGQEPETAGKYTALDYQCDIAAIPVPDAAFDAVVCTEVLEHVPDPFAAVAEMARILKPGGRLILTAPLASLLHQEPYHFYGGYTAYWYRRFLPAHGFEIDAIDENLGFFSLFGTHALRYLWILRTADRKHLGLPARIGVQLVRAAMWPAAQILPPLGRWLDRLKIDNCATAGYHVLATRK